MGQAQFRMRAHAHLPHACMHIWWSSKQGRRKPCWFSWDVMTRPKNLRGLGFCDLEVFNLALLSRQAWRVLNEPHMLSARILKGPTSRRVLYFMQRAPTRHKYGVLSWMAGASYSMESYIASVMERRLVFGSTTGSRGLEC